MARGVTRKKIKIIKKRGLEEWLEGDNLLILKGIALQCLTFEDIADCIGVHPDTLKGWRKKSEEFAEAVDLGREEADAVVLAVSFEAAVRGDSLSQDRWWRYRLSRRFESEFEKEVALNDAEGNRINLKINLSRADE
jgi:hypothetical protein